MAEYVMKSLLKEKGLLDQAIVASAATSREEIGNDMYPPAKRKLSEKGISYDRHHARQVQKEEYEKWDHIFYMDGQNYRNLMRIFGSDPSHKIQPLLDRDVADPWYTGNFERTYQDVLEGCQLWLERIFE